MSKEIGAQNGFGNVSYEEPPTEISPQSKVKCHIARPVRRYGRPIGCGECVVGLSKPARDKRPREHANVRSGIDEETNTGGFISYKKSAGSRGAGVASRH